MLRLFERYELAELVYWSGYSDNHLRLLRSGNRPVTPEFTRKMTALLQARGEDVTGLFEDAEEVPA